jgi:hypothetical protein
MIESHGQCGILIEAFRRTGGRQVIAGNGSGRARLAASARPKVELVGHVVDDLFVPLMQRCQALIFPSRVAVQRALRFRARPIEWVTVAAGGR